MSFRKLYESLTAILVTSFVFVALVVLPSVNSSYFSESTALAARAGDDEQRKPPEARSSQTLSSRVAKIIIEVQEFRDLEDYASALASLARVKEMNDEDRLNDREKYTMWIFYATIAQSQTEYSDAIVYFNEILKLDEALTPVQLEQTLESIGALDFVLERYEDAIDIYMQYNEVALEPKASIYLRIAQAYYQIEQHADAIPYVVRNMEIDRANGDEVKESTYSLLRALYITLEDYENSRQVTREMIVLFYTPDDWTFLSSIQSQLEMFEQQSLTYYISNVIGFLDSEAQFMNLAAQLFNSENPYGAAQVVKMGIDDGIIEENEKNLSFLSQAYQVAREDALAVAPLIRAAEMAEDGDLYNRLGIIYSTMGEFESSADAFDKALEKGGLDRMDQVYIRQAVAFYQLNRFEEGIKSAKEAGKFEKGEEASENWIKSLENEKRRYDVQEEKREQFKDFFL